MIHLFIDSAMDSPIVRTTTRAILPILFLFALFVLFRGHNQPGGGFIGGLVAAVAIILLAMGGGNALAEAVVSRAKARLVMGFGLLCSGTAAVVPLFLGKALMTATWLDITIPSVGLLGTPLLFDIGVFFTVIGMTLMVVLRLIEKVE